MSPATPDVELFIHFDNPEEMYFSGEPVTGFVTSKVNNRLKVSGECLENISFMSYLIMSINRQ